MRGFTLAVEPNGTSLPTVIAFNAKRQSGLRGLAQLPYIRVEDCVPGKADICAMRSKFPTLNREDSYAFRQNRCQSDVCGGHQRQIVGLAENGISDRNCAAPQVFR